MIPRFINLLASDVWTWADIDNRARAHVASIVPIEREDELQTIAIGAALGMRAPSEKEMGEILQVKALKEEAGLRILEARADMALLAETMALEAARARLAREPSDQPDDAPARAAAQAVVDAASQAAIDLAAQRNPTPPQEPSP